MPKALVGWERLGLCSGAFCACGIYDMSLGRCRECGEDAQSG